VSRCARTCPGQNTRARTKRPHPHLSQDSTVPDRPPAPRLGDEASNRPRPGTQADRPTRRSINVGEHRQGHAGPTPRQPTCGRSNPPGRPRQEPAARRDPPEALAPTRIPPGPRRAYEDLAAVARSGPPPCRRSTAVSRDATAPGKGTWPVPSGRTSPDPPPRPGREPTPGLGGGTGNPLGPGVPV